jgi:ATP-dependent Clp protease ATP-binding subunit ClpA
MFERFTEPSRRVVVLAQEEARMLDHNYIGSEHILLGLIREEEGVAARAIVSFGLTLEMAREQVRDLIGAGQQTPTGHIPFTSRAKMILELSLREALALKKEYIGTEHILLGLARDGGGVGAQILITAAPLAAVREKVLLLAAAAAAEENAAGPDEQLAAGWLASGLQASGTGLRLPPWAVASVRAQVVSEFREALASIGGTLEALERRLTGIERQLGITPEAGHGPDEPTRAAEDAAEARPEAAQAPDRTGEAPEGETPEESAD